MSGNAYSINMSDKRLCASFSTIKCWDFYSSVEEVKGLHTDKSVKQLSVSDNLVCTISTQNELLCVKSSVGKFNIATPEGLNKVTKVAAGYTSTAIIDTKGNLQFWFNYPMYNPENDQIFTGYKNGKVSISKNYLCAINQTKQLTCWRIKAGTAKLEQTKVPKFLNENVIEVSAGKDQICAISSKKALVCWRYPDNRTQLEFVPKPLYTEDNAKSVSTGYNKHCGVDKTNKLYCWGINENNSNTTNQKNKKYLEEFEGKVKQVSVGIE